MAQLKVKQISDFVSAVEGKINGMVGTSVSNAISSAVSGASSTLSTALSAEISRAEGIEADLSAEIVTVAGDLSSYEVSNDAALSTEVSRATAAEGVLTSDLSNEVSRATAAEGVLTSNLSNEVSRATAAEGVLTSDLSTEVSRATAAEGVLTSNLSNEVSRATAAEANLSVALYNESVDRANGDADTLSDAKVYSDIQKGRIDALLMDSSAALDTFKEIEDFIGQLETADIDGLITAISTAEQNAKDYADGLAVNYDAVGSAADALSDAKVYANGLAVNYDAAGSATTAEQNAKDYADGLASNYDAAGSAADALSDAKVYANGLAVNYDAAGSATTAENNANSYTDGEIGTLSTDVATVTNALDGRLDTAESDIIDLDGRIDALEGLDVSQQVGDFINQNTFRVTVPFRTGDLGLKVFINGLQIHAEAAGDGYTVESDGMTFNLIGLGYDIDAQDHIIVYGVLGNV